MSKTSKPHELQMIRHWFERLGLKLEQVHALTSEDVGLQLQRLEKLQRWVVAYWRFGGREELERRGYWFPPIEPDFDPNTDWERFELWLQGGPTPWGRKREPE